jgi:hypothetical protein
MSVVGLAGAGFRERAHLAVVDPEEFVVCLDLGM